MPRRFTFAGIGLGIYLLGLGITYLLDHTSGFVSFSFWLRLFPVLTILLGLDFVLCSINRGSDTFHKPDGLITTVIILITIFGFTLGFTPRFWWSDLQKLRQFDFSRDDPFDFGRGFRQTLEEDFKLPVGVNNLQVENKFGDVEVETGSGDTITVTAKIRFYGRGRSRNLDSYDPGLKLSGDREGDAFVIKLTNSQSDDDFIGPRINVKIAVNVPPGVSVVIQNKAGNVKVGSIGGNLTIEASAGSIKVDHVAKNLTVHNSFGEIMIGTVLGNAEIYAATGEVKVKKINGTANVECSMGNVNLDECGGPVNARVKTGQLKVGFTTVKGTSELDCKMGNVELNIPSGSKFSLEASTSLGNIHSDFPLTKHQEMASSSATGRINNGGPLIRANTNCGNIEIREM